MYAGHAGIALALKARHPEVVVAPLVLACYGPDWLETIMKIFAMPFDAVVYSHSFPAVLVGAMLAGLLYGLAFGRAGAWSVVAGWLLHWPADFFTGTKPLFDEGHMVGLHLYELPWADLILETIVVAGACLLYRRAFGTSRARRRTILVMGVALVTAQASLDYLFASHSGWGFALAQRERRPHLTMVVMDRCREGLCMPLAQEGGTSMERD